MSESVDEQAGGKKSAWMMHVKKTMRAHRGKKLGEVLKMASKTFKKTKRGGAVLTPATVGGGDEGMANGPVATGGRRRRGSRKSRGSRRR